MSNNAASPNPWRGDGNIIRLAILFARNGPTDQAWMSTKRSPTIGTCSAPSAKRLPTGALDTYQHDSNGNLLQSVDGDGHILKYQYDALDRPTTETWLAAAIVNTPSETIQAVVLKHGATAGTWTLSFNGAPTAAIAYNATAADVQTADATAAQLQAALANLPLLGAGNVQVIGSGTWASPFLVSFVGALAGQAEPALTVAGMPATVNTIATNYNADSQITSIGDNYSHYGYTFDGQGNVASVDNAGTPGGVPEVKLASQFDAMGNRMSLGATIDGTADFWNTYSYDALSRLDQINQQGNGGNTVAEKSIYFGLDGIGQVTEIDRANMVNAGPTQNGPGYSVVSYNTLGQLTQINHEHSGASLDNLSWTYDGVGRVSTFTSIDGTATYGYDPTSQLTSATYSTASGGHQPGNESYSFDTNGNRTAVNGASTTVAPNNEVTNDGAFTDTFDGAGNRLTRTRISGAPANDYKVSYTWDTRNRLVEVQDFNNSGTLTEQLDYTYDVYDRLIQRDDNVIGGSTTATHYVWDYLGQPASAVGNIVLAFDISGELSARYLNGPNLSAYDQFFSTLAEEDVGTPSKVTWDLLDNEGTLGDVIDADGVLEDHLSYNSHGQLTYESSPTVSRIDGYAGGLYDPSTQLVYFIHRWYDPLATVWISADPIGFAAGDMNLHRYVANDPTGFVDSAGLEDIRIDVSHGGGLKNDSGFGQPTRGMPSQGPLPSGVTGTFNQTGNTGLVSIYFKGGNTCNTISGPLGGTIPTLDGNGTYYGGMLTAYLADYPLGKYRVTYRWSASLESSCVDNPVRLQGLFLTTPNGKGERTRTTLIGAPTPVGKPAPGATLGKGVNFGETKTVTVTVSRRGADTPIVQLEPGAIRGMNDNAPPGSRPAAPGPIYTPGACCTTVYTAYIQVLQVTAVKPPAPPTRPAVAPELPWWWPRPPLTRPPY